MKLLKSGTNKKQSKRKNGEKKPQFAETLIYTALQKNGISKIKLSVVSGLFANTELTKYEIKHIFIAHLPGYFSQVMQASSNVQRQ